MSDEIAELHEDIKRVLADALAEVDALRAHNARLENERNSAYLAMATARGRADEMEARAFRMRRVCEAAEAVHVLEHMQERFAEDLCDDDPDFAVASDIAHDLIRPRFSDALDAYEDALTVYRKSLEDNNNGSNNNAETTSAGAAS